MQCYWQFSIISTLSKPNEFYVATAHIDGKFIAVILGMHIDANYACNYKC